MTMLTILVCTSCSATIAHDDVTDDTRTEGVLLKEQLEALQQQGDLTDAVNIQAVGCLWTCDRPCSVSFVCPDKYTYHFVDLNYEACATELQQFADLYLKSTNGYVKPPKMPGELRSHLLVRIPALEKAQPF